MPRGMYEGNQIRIIDPANESRGGGYPLIENIFNTFDAPALRDLQRRFEMIQMGMPIESVIAAGSPAEQSFKKYFGNLPASQTISTTPEIMGYDVNAEPITKPGITYKAPPFFPGSVRNWAEQQIAKGQELPEQIAAATGMTKSPTASQILAPRATEALMRYKGNLQIQGQFKSVLNALRRNHPDADPSALAEQAMWELNQASNGNLYPEARPVPEEILGPSKERSRQTHERMQLLEKEAGKDRRLGKQIDAQAALRESINLKDKEIASQRDATKRAALAQDKEKWQMIFDQRKVDLFTRASRALENLGMSGTDAIEMAKQIADGTRVSDLQIPEMARAAMDRALQRADEVHQARITREARTAVDASGKTDEREFKLAKLELDVADRMIRLQQLAAKDPAAENHLKAIRFQKDVAMAAWRMGDTDGARAALKPLGEIFDVELSAPGTIERFLSILGGAKPSAEAKPGGTVFPPQGNYKLQTQPIEDMVQGVGKRIQELRRPTAVPQPQPVPPAAPSLQQTPTGVPPTVLPRSMRELQQRLNPSRTP